MKTVAIVGADFTPSSLPPALRIRFFAQHLPKFGWHPIIITTEAKYYECAIDPENERLLPDALEVIRTPALSAEVTRKIGIGDIGMRSLWHHWWALVKLCKSQKVDLVFIPVPPYVPMVLGRFIHRRFGIPYVIDYIDPWITGYYWKLPRAHRPPKWEMAYTLSRLLEPFAAKRVAHIVGVSKGTTDSVVTRYPWLSDADTTEIPYGGEAADFDYVRLNPRCNKVFNRNDGHFHISYVGACIPAMHATVRALFGAVRLGLKRAPVLFDRLRLHFVGTTYAPNADDLNQVLPLAREMGVQDVVDERPSRVSYLDAIQILLDSHALVIVGSDASHYTASKIFPYILAKKPLLAVFHEASSVVAILQETRAGLVTTFNAQQTPTMRIEEILSQLEQILLLPSGHQPPTRWDAFEPYTTQAMTARLSQAFEEAIHKQAGR